MLKLSCNGTDQIQALSQCRLLAPARSLLARRSSTVVFRSPATTISPVSASLSDRTGFRSEGVVNRVEPSSVTLADRLRLGSLTEDGLSYKEKFIVRSYEVGINKTATVETIANLLQEVGCNHAQSVGFSTDGFATTPTMRKLHLIWVTARMHIEVYKYPAWSDVVEIETWCQGEGRVGTRRDFILKDYATNEVIGRATSKWVMMNEDTRRLQKVSDDVREEYLIFCPREPRLSSLSLPYVAMGLFLVHGRSGGYWLSTSSSHQFIRLSFPEENNNSLKKIPKLEDPAQYSRLGLVPRRADLDMNKHVNNVTYIGWLLESMPQEIIDSHELQSITLDYRRECQQDDVVDSLTNMELPDGAEAVPELQGTNGSTIAREDKQEECQQFLHLLRLSSDGLEINRGRTEWRKKAPR
ncbi:oleoyl-acyl carrier protein thioesterase 1, chloroplastic [Senna tora]|uniref:Acyl-[acyl-carrier-protein] hydrolase n=1 Tax=Senna tora TaxID=362788 RepID=A0A834TR54_9FABA|nr:oleoyl-acyl carrier protein thioesterase 1, chloroplastic [Senna tora]